MKKHIVLLFALIACTSLLSGCLAIRYTNEGGFDIQAGMDGLTETQQIVIADAATGAKLADFAAKDDIKRFMEKLDIGKWNIKTLADMPPETERECVITMMQAETVKAGMEPEDVQAVRVCTLYTYRDSGCLTMEFPFASFTFTLTAEAEEYLHRFAQ